MAVVPLKLDRPLLCWRIEDKGSRPTGSLAEVAAARINSCDQKMRLKVLVNLAALKQQVPHIQLRGKVQNVSLKKESLTFFHRLSRTEAIEAP